MIFYYETLSDPTDSDLALVIMSINYDKFLTIGNALFIKTEDIIIDRQIIFRLRCAR